MDDFQKRFSGITDFVADAAKSLMGKIDHFTFKMLVDLLKSDDYEAVNNAIQGLEKEKGTLGIAPLYFVSKEHPNTLIRERATKAIAKIGDEKRVAELTEGKTTEEAVKALIQEYGNYRS